jgi:hypothetical protein
MDKFKPHLFKKSKVRPANIVDIVRAVEWSILSYGSLSEHENINDRSPPHVIEYVAMEHMLRHAELKRVAEQNEVYLALTRSLQGLQITDLDAMPVQGPSTLSLSAASTSMNSLVDHQAPIGDHNEDIIRKRRLSKVTTKPTRSSKRSKAVDYNSEVKTIVRQAIKDLSVRKATPAMALVVAKEVNLDLWSVVQAFVEGGRRRLQDHVYGRFF